VPLDLQAALRRVYETGAYRYRINYRKPCHPLLADEDQAWANGLIQAALGTPQLQTPPETPEGNP
jgi:hypothetical protein